MLDRRDPEHPLPALRSRVRWIIWWSGASCCLTVLLGGLILAGWFDWWLRIDDAGLRVLLAVTLWTVVAVTFWRTLLGPLRAPLSDVFLAEQIERRYPGYAGRISSAAAFLDADCAAHLGSPELQRLIVAQAEAELQHVDPAQVVTTRPVRLVTLLAVASCVLAAVVLLTFPLEAATAVRRLAWPWGHQPWPQTTILRLLTRDGEPIDRDPQEPWQLVRGDTLELLVENERGRLPEQVWLETRPARDLPPLREVLPRVSQNGDAKPARAQLSLPAVSGPLDFRVVGGDDRSMPWYTLHVVEPPRLESYEIQVAPPEYTGQPVQVLPQGATQIRGWIGSQVRITATANRPLASVTLQGRDRAPERLALSSDALAWSATLTIEHADATAVWFQMRDQQGFFEREPLQFGVRGDIDALPQVSLVEPAADLVVTPDAQVPLAIEARDDLGVTTLRLTWQRNDETPQTAPLFKYAEPVAEVNERTSWNLAELTPSPGDRIVFRIEALDACTIGVPHVAKSGPRTLHVASPPEKRAELQARAGELVDDLRDTAELQTRLRDQTHEVQTQLQAAGELRPQDRDLLRRVELDQRNLAGRFDGGPASLAERAERLQSEFEFNGLSDPETQAGLQQLASQLQQLSQITAPQVTHKLTQAAKLLAGGLQPEPEQPTEDRRAAGQWLDQAIRDQTDVIETLADLERALAEWRGQHDLNRELSHLVAEQEQMLTATAELGAQTVARSAAELSPQQRADLARLAARQRRQAERIGQFQQQLEQLKNVAREQDLATSDAAEDAAERLRSAQAEARARQAANDISANRLGQAAESQRVVRDALAELQQEWEAQQPNDVEQLLKRLAGLQQQAEQLVKQHDELQQRIEAAVTATPDQPSLPEQAAELRRKAQRLERQLERLRLRRAADAARRAAEHLRRIESQSAADADGEQLQREMQQAEDDLEQIQQELQREQQAAEERLAQEQFERVAQALDALKLRQTGVIAETERLEQERAARGQWTRGQLRSLKDLADVERELAEESARIVEQLEGAAALQAAMRRVQFSLQQAAERLSERQTDEHTLRLERDAIRRLEHLLSAWNSQPPIDESQPPAERQPSEDESQGKTAGPPGESVPPHVQLQLLRNWQADCLDRTAAWHKAHPNSEKTLPDEQAELDALADEQGELARLAQQIVDAMQSATAASKPEPPDAEGKP